MDNNDLAIKLRDVAKHFTMLFGNFDGQARNKLDFLISFKEVAGSYFARIYVYYNIIDFFDRLHSCFSSNFAGKHNTLHEFINNYEVGKMSDNQVLNIEFSKSAYSCLNFHHAICDIIQSTEIKKNDRDDLCQICDIVCGTYVYDHMWFMNFKITKFYCKKLLFDLQISTKKFHLKENFYNVNYVKEITSNGMSIIGNFINKQNLHESFKIKYILTFDLNDKLYELLHNQNIIDDFINYLNELLAPDVKKLDHIESILIY